MILELTPDINFLVPHLQSKSPFKGGVAAIAVSAGELKVVVLLVVVLLVVVFLVVVLLVVVLLVVGLLVVVVGGLVEHCMTET